MAKYRKKPIVIDAVQWFKHKDNPYVEANFGLVEGKCVKCDKAHSAHGWIPTLEGRHVVCPTDWIITGIKGERYPCKPDIFEATYEKVE